jgi:hypothetical protein
MFVIFSLFHAPVISSKNLDIKSWKDT